MTDASSPSIVQVIFNSIRGIDSSRQLALGISIGLLIGILPKDNLIFAGLLVFLVVSGANLVTGFVAAVVGSLVSIQIESLLHFAGQQILGTDFVSTLLAQLMGLPLVAWTDINNTVVCGGLFVGLALFVPVYFVSFGIFHHLRTSVRKLIEPNAISGVSGCSAG